MNWQQLINQLRSLFGSAPSTGGGTPTPPTRRPPTITPPVTTPSVPPAPSPAPTPVVRPPVPPTVTRPPAPVVPVPPVVTAPPVLPPVVPPVTMPPVIPAPPTVTPPRPPAPAPTVVLPQEGVRLDFGRLWRNHPNISDTEMQPCRRPDGVANFGNQCAIRMGTCLTRSGLLKNYDGEQCWFGHSGEGHTLRARELATWLRNHASTFGAVEIRSGVRWQDYVNRTGIIFCENFWGEGNQGDHIDLWDGTGEFMGSGAFSWEGPAMASGGLDYIERSEKVWLWPVY